MGTDDFGEGEAVPARRRDDPIHLRAGVDVGALFRLLTAHDVAVHLKGTDGYPLEDQGKSFLTVHDAGAPTRSGALKKSHKGSAPNFTPPLRGLWEKSLPARE